MNLSNLLSWSYIVRKLQLFSLIVSIFLNCILITIILLRSPKKFGFYKYILCYIAVYEILYSIFDYVVEPFIFAHGYAFVVFRVCENSIFDKEQSFNLITVTCGVFTSSLSIFAVHFVYRYSALDGKFYQRYLKGSRISVLFIIPIVFGIVWTYICNIFFYFSPESEDYLRNSILDMYDIPIKRTSPMIVMYYQTDEHRRIHPDLNIFFSMGILCFMQSVTVFIVIYFGIRTYLKIKTVTRVHRMASNIARSIHFQLLQALVVQTTIPVILLYIPIYSLFFFPMANHDIGFGSNFVAYNLSIFPAIDPLPILFIIKSYREANFFVYCFAFHVKRNPHNYKMDWHFNDVIRYYDLVPMGLLRHQ